MLTTKLRARRDKEIFLTLTSQKADVKIYRKMLKMCLLSCMHIHWQESCSSQ
jgi:hypothetical protein